MGSPHLQDARQSLLPCRNIDAGKKWIGQTVGLPILIGLSVGSFCQCVCCFGETVDLENLLDFILFSLAILFYILVESRFYLFNFKEALEDALTLT